MARSHATIYGTAWSSESDFRTLPLEAQWLYVALLAQPDLNLCGVMPYIPQRWVRFAPDLDAGRVEAIVAMLELRGYVITDQDTVELWVRQFMFHDRVLAQPQVAMAAASAFAAVQSTRLRYLIVQSLPPTLRDGWPDNLRGIKRDQAKALLEGCDAASWKPSASPSTSPNARGDSLGVTQALTEGSGLGSGSGSGFHRSSLTSADPVSHLSTRSRAAGSGSA